MLPWIVGATVIALASMQSNNKQNIKLFKLGGLYIKNHKMFKKFNIGFLDSNAKKILPIIVIAGKNGSGKTTLLEYIYKYIADKDDDYIFLAKEIDNEVKLSKMAKGEDGIIEIRKKYKENVIYFSAGMDNIKEIKESILEHYRRLMRKYSHIDALKEIQKFLNTVFTDDMEITFTIEDIDIVLRDNEKVIFKNKNGDTFDINELSTGEKTLLSKVLYLYFKDYKNKVILIDEPELSLHPSWQNKVLKIYENFAKQNDCQVIIATHSPHIIASTKNKYLRFLEKDEEGKIRVINDLEAYGRDVEWVLQRMGVKNLRVSEILERFTHCQELLNEKKYDEAEECINDLEEEIGQHDTKVMSLRNALFFERY